MPSTGIDSIKTDSSVFGAAVTIGFVLAVAMWCAAFVTHFPGLELPSRVAGPCVLAVWLVAAVIAGGLVPRGRAGLVGLLGGALSALLSVLILGAILVEQPKGDVPAQGFRGLPADAALSVVGFIALGAAIGLIGGLVGSRLRPNHTRPADWLARFGVVAAVAIVPLLLLGGLVTSTNSGMAIIGWPDSYGANMFLYPVALMADPGRFLEHTHRLYGSLVGLTTGAFLIYVLAADHRRWMRKYAALLFVLVIVQGVLGGVRVRQGSVDANLDNRYLSLFHGVLAQLFFAMVVAGAAFVSRGFRNLMDPATGAAPSPEPRALRRLRGMSTGLLHSMILQLLLGATYRHLKASGTTGANHALWAHIGFSFIVLAAALATGFAARSADRSFGPLQATYRRLGVLLVGVVVAQFCLGWAALWALNADVSPRASWVPPLLATLHQGNGAVLLALATLVFTWTRALCKRAGPPVQPVAR
ncbi:MAG: COX15/CtaA family protein [Phycisphaeraceae bacterium]|nr:COX15/CtaA family protein [Phycisphaeraceae bacterium]